MKVLVLMTVGTIALALGSCKKSEKNEPVASSSAQQSRLTVEDDGNSNLIFVHELDSKPGHITPTDGVDQNIISD